MFLKIDYDLLRCEGYNSATKLVISYLHSLQSSGRSFWGNSVYLASLFGTSPAKVEKLLWEMEELGLITRTAEGYVLALSFAELIKAGTKIDDKEI